MAPIHLSAYFAPTAGEKEGSSHHQRFLRPGLRAHRRDADLLAPPRRACTSFTVSLRHQLKDTSVKVFENRAAGGRYGTGRRQRIGGIQRHPASEVAGAALKALAKDKYDIRIGRSQNLVTGSRKNFAKAFEELIAGDIIDLVSDMR